MQKNLCASYVLNDLEHKKLFYDSKTILQEMRTERLSRRKLSYELLGEEGPDHDKQFRRGGTDWREGIW